jgi:hypothetical protein
MSDQTEEPEEPGFAEREGGDESPQTGGGVDPEEVDQDPRDSDPDDAT